MYIKFFGVMHMESYNLLQRHKTDDDRVEMIKKMDRDKILPLLPHPLNGFKT